ncbi:MAG TPA: alpha-2-macroglobulin family protein [Polyangia bacterium]|nr:alpha-2-macroglobulin family protein [Polyangia bacterium]
MKDYFGGAASDVAVSFTVSRQRWVPWWSWRSHASPKVEVARGQVKTDKRGNFDISFVASPDPETAPPEDPDAPDVSDFIVDVSAHDAGGRTMTAERKLRVGRQALLAQIDAAHGFYFSDEKPQLHVKASNLAEQPQATTLQWTLERLAAPEHAANAPDAVDAVDDRPLQAQLAQFPLAAGAPVATGQVQTAVATPATLTLPMLPAGGYRVRVHGGDAKASYAFVVVDAKTRALPLPLPALAIARDTAAQPGDKVQLLLGDSAGTGAYHLEIWRATHLVSHRVERGAPLRVVTIPVDAALAGGFTARWIGARGLRVIGADATLRVERKDKALTVQLVGQPAALEPGQKAHWSLSVHDGKGRPVGGEALVKIYDRSLDIYANDNQSWMYARNGSDWAEELWAPPDNPLAREEGVQRVWAQEMPGDREARERQEKAIAGSYKEKLAPRLLWEDVREGGRRRPRGLAGNFISDSVMRPAEAELRTPAPAMRHAPMSKTTSFGAAAANTVTGAPPPPPAQPSAPPPPPPPPNANALSPRTNMAETALFAPDVHLGDDGKGAFDFRAPERLTSWRVQVFALGHRVEAGRVESTFVTRKPLMVRVEIPRFFREGDRSQIAAIVHNETAQPLAADVELAVRDDAGGHSALAALGIADAKRHVEVPAHGLVAVEYPIVAPENIAHYIVRASAHAGKLADAEERTLPLLPSRERLVQSQVVALRGDDQKTLDFAELSHNQDASLRSDSMTVSIDPELALSVLRAIPSLVEYPYECAEQTVNRYVPLAIVARIYAQHPELARAIAAAPKRDTAHEPWVSPPAPNDNDSRRLVTLMETPWLADAQGGGNDAQLRSLLDPAAVQTMGKAALEKLARMQTGSGGFPWFAGGHDNLYMTLYVLEQLGMLQEFGIDAPHDVVKRALAYVAHELAHEPTKVDEASLAYLAYGAYVLTSFDGARYPAVKALRPDVEAWMKRVVANKLHLTPFGRAWAARVMARLGDQTTALMLLESALDGAKRDPVIGVYWTPERYSWLWYSDSVEKHAFFLRTLAELKPNDDRVPGMLQWLLFNRKGNEWRSTKASAAAVYSILALMQKQGSLTQPEKFHVVWDKQEELVTVKPTEDRRQPLQWTVRGRDVTPARGRVQVGKTGPGVAFASATWVYSSTKLQAAHDSSLLDLQRVYYRRVHAADGDHLLPLKSGDQVHVGEDLEVRLTVKAKSQLDFVHVKEPRGAGFEETTLTSGYHWDRVPAYEEPRDTLFNFFVDWLPAGEVELRHSLRPTTPGRYRIGSAVVQSMYSPDVAAFSAGMELEVLK